MDAPTSRRALRVVLIAVVALAVAAPAACFVLTGPLTEGGHKVRAMLAKRGHFPSP